MAEDQIFIVGAKAASRPALYIGLRNPDIFRLLAIMHPRFERAHVSGLGQAVDPYQRVLALLPLGNMFPEQAADCLSWLRAQSLTVDEIRTAALPENYPRMIHQALHRLDLDGLDVVFIENVGNLVCPASFDLGQHLNVILLSVPEGDDKPAKYPVMFRAADLVLISKSDLLPVLDDFKPEKAKQYLHDIASDAPVFELSSKDSSGMQHWYDWLFAQIDKQRAYLAEHPVAADRYHHHHGHEHKHEHEHQHVHAEYKSP